MKSKEEENSSGKTENKASGASRSLASGTGYSWKFQPLYHSVLHFLTGTAEVTRSLLFLPRCK